MAKRDEWLWDGDCNNCKIQKQCLQSCRAHKQRIERIDRRKGEQANVQRK